MYLSFFRWVCNTIRGYLVLVVILPNQHRFKNLSGFHILECTQIIVRIVILDQFVQRVFPLFVLVYEKWNHLGFLSATTSQDTKMLDLTSAATLPPW